MAKRKKGQGLTITKNYTKN